MMPRAGFTLLEVMVAIVVTGLVALLAYGTAAAGFDTKERLDVYRTTVEARMIVRSLLLDALRHPPEGGGAAMNEALFTLHDRYSADGLPADEVAFRSRGVIPPFGATGEWSVTLTPSVLGLRLLAVPLDAGAAAPIDAYLAGVTGLEVRVLDRSGATVWEERWQGSGRVPAAVALEFLGPRGEPAAPPLIVHAALERVR